MRNNFVVISTRSSSVIDIAFDNKVKIFRDGITYDYVMNRLDLIQLDQKLPNYNRQHHRFSDTYKASYPNIDKIDKKVELVDGKYPYDLMVDILGEDFSDLELDKYLNFIADYALERLSKYYLPKKTSLDISVKPIDTTAKQKSFIREIIDFFTFLFTNKRPNDDVEYSIESSIDISKINLEKIIKDGIRKYRKNLSWAEIDYLDNLDFTMVFYISFPFVTKTPILNIY